MSSTHSSVNMLCDHSVCVPTCFREHRKRGKECCRRTKACCVPRQRTSQLKPSYSVAKLHCCHAPIVHATLTMILCRYLHSLPSSLIPCLGRQTNAPVKHTPHHTNTHDIARKACKRKGRPVISRQGYTDSSWSPAVWLSLARLRIARLRDVPPQQTHHSDKEQ